MYLAHVSLPDLVDFADEEGKGKYLDLHEVYDYYMYIPRPQADRSTSATIVILWS